MVPRLVPFLLLLGCQGSGPDTEEPPEAEKTLVFEMRAKERTFDDCVAGSDGCTYVRLDYPIIVEAIEGMAIDTINDTVTSFVAAPLQPDAETGNADAVMEEFIAGYAALKVEEPDYEHPWFLERKAYIVNNTPELVCVSFATHSYLGGAHGRDTITFANLDPRTGEQVPLSTIFVDGYEEALLSLAESRFREVREIEEGMSLTDAGFTFANDTFALTDNFAIGENGLTFYYNAYDVAPYALGATEIVLPYEELDSLLRE